MLTTFIWNMTSVVYGIVKLGVFFTATLKCFIHPHDTVRMTDDKQ